MVLRNRYILYILYVHMDETQEVQYILYVHMDETQEVQYILYVHMYVCMHIAAYLVLTSSLHLVMIRDSSKKTGNHALCQTLSASSRL